MWLGAPLLLILSDLRGWASWVPASDRDDIWCILGLSQDLLCLWSHISVPSLFRDFVEALEMPFRHSVTFALASYDVIVRTLLP